MEDYAIQLLSSNSESYYVSSIKGLIGNYNNFYCIKKLVQLNLVQWKSENNLEAVLPLKILAISGNPYPYVIKNELKYQKIYKIMYRETDICIVEIHMKIYRSNSGATLKFINLEWFINTMKSNRLKLIFQMARRSSSFISKIPPEISLHIISFLSPIPKLNLV